MSHLRSRFRSKIAAIALVVFLMPAGPGHAADDVNVRFSWKLKGEYAALYTALDRGFFSKRDLNVRLGEGAGAPAALGALLQGQEDIVVLPGIFAISAIQKGMPIKIIAMYQPKTPVVIIGQPGTTLTTPKDMENKSIAGAVGETSTSYLGVFCKVNNIDCGTIRVIQLDATARVPAFVQKQVDFVGVYRNNDLPILEQTTKVKYPLLDMAANGLPIPGLSLVASDSGIAKHRDVLKRFLAAMNEAIDFANREPEAAAAAMIKNWPGAPALPIVVAQVEATNVSTTQSAPGAPAGRVDPKSIEFSIGLLQAAEEIGQPKPTATFYDNTLLPD
jgi:NitT/TauT family transport system substrate-binding protein